MVRIDNHCSLDYIIHMNSTTIDRFWSKVTQTKSCWLWQASKRAKGYGAFVWADETGQIIQGRAHRFSWILRYGPIPSGLCVLHKCDVPACVNPDHLFLGSRATNNLDMCAKGRHVRGGTYHEGKYARGSSHPASKLSDETVRKMRAIYALSKPSFSNLAAQFGVTTTCAWKIIRRIHWSHLE